MKICIIDDSKFIRERLISNLNERIPTIEIREAEGIKQIKEVFLQFLPDVVVIDVHLQDGTGFEVLELTSQIGFYPLKIVLTNYALEPYKKKAQALGADYFLDKSTDFDKAIEIIEKSKCTHE